MRAFSQSVLWSTLILLTQSFRHTTDIRPRTDDTGKQSLDAESSELIPTAFVSETETTFIDDVNKTQDLVKSEISLTPTSTTEAVQDISTDNASVGHSVETQQTFVGNQDEFITEDSSLPQPIANIEIGKPFIGNESNHSVENTIIMLETSSNRSEPTHSINFRKENSSVLTKTTSTSETTAADVVIQSVTKDPSDNQTNSDMQNNSILVGTTTNPVLTTENNILSENTTLSFNRLTDKINSNSSIILHSTVSMIEDNSSNSIESHSTHVTAYSPTVTDVATNDLLDTQTTANSDATNTNGTTQFLNSSSYSTGSMSSENPTTESGVFSNYTVPELNNFLQQTTSTIETSSTNTTDVSSTLSSVNSSDESLTSESQVTDKQFDKQTTVAMDAVSTSSAPITSQMEDVTSNRTSTTKFSTVSPLFKENSSLSTETSTPKNSPSSGGETSNSITNIGQTTDAGDIDFKSTPNAPATMTELGVTVSILNNTQPDYPTKETEAGIDHRTTNGYQGITDAGQKSTVLVEQAGTTQSENTDKMGTDQNSTTLNPGINNTSSLSFTPGTSTYMTTSETHSSIELSTTVGTTVVPEGTDALLVTDINTGSLENRVTEDSSQKSTASDVTTTHEATESAITSSTKELTDDSTVVTHVEITPIFSTETATDSQQNSLNDSSVSTTQQTPTQTTYPEAMDTSIVTTTSAISDKSSAAFITPDASSFATEPLVTTMPSIAVESEPSYSTLTSTLGVNNTNSYTSPDSRHTTDHTTTHPPPVTTNGATATKVTTTRSPRPSITTVQILYTTTGKRMDDKEDDKKKKKKDKRKKKSDSDDEDDDDDDDDEEKKKKKDKKHDHDDNDKADDDDNNKDANKEKKKKKKEKKRKEEKNEEDKNDDDTKEDTDDDHQYKKEKKRRSSERDSANSDTDADD